MRTELLGHLDEVIASVRGLSNNRTTPAPTAILAQILESLPFAALVADDHGRYVLTNRAASELTGYRPTELRRLSVWDLTPGANAHEAEILWRAFLQQDEQSGDYPLVTKTGRVVNAEYAAKTDVLPGLHLSLLTSQSKRSGGETRLKTLKERDGVPESGAVRRAIAGYLKTHGIVVGDKSERKRVATRQRP